MMKFSYQTKENRDLKAKELKLAGHLVKKSSIGNQLTHPMYIEDWPYKLTEQDKGFGNGIYKTFFKKIYSVEVV